MLNLFQQPIRKAHPACHTLCMWGPETNSG